MTSPYEPKYRYSVILASGTNVIHVYADEIGERVNGTGQIIALEFKTQGERTAHFGQPINCWWRQDTSG
jgi:hypothetical protein